MNPSAAPLTSNYQRDTVCTNGLRHSVCLVGGGRRTPNGMHIRENGGGQ